MSKVHYIIDSRKKAQIEKKEQGKMSVVIQDAVMIVENGRVKIDYENLISGTEDKVKNRIASEVISVILYVFGILSIMGLYVLLGVVPNTTVYTDNLIGIAALLFGLTTIPKVKEYLGKILVGPQLIKKLWCITMILILPFYIIWIMVGVGISIEISNICGIAGIVISILVW